MVAADCSQWREKEGKEKAAWPPVLFTPQASPLLPSFGVSDALVSARQFASALFNFPTSGFREGFWLWELARTSFGSLLFGDWQKKHFLFDTLKKSCLIPNGIYWQKKENETHNEEESGPTKSSQELRGRAPLLLEGCFLLLPFSTTIDVRSLLATSIL